MNSRVWSAERNEASQKGGKLSRKSEQVSFDDEGSYLKKTYEDGKVTTDFKRLPKIQSGAALQAEVDKKNIAGMKKGGKVKSASARADGVAQRGKTKGRMV